jgi:NAD(P)-dependent dehydrogenase (short-subunit alcohol dehydrogenase family)
MDPNDKRPVVLVTGAARGIGATTVACLAERGARVFAVDIGSDVVEYAAEFDGQVIGHVADLADPSQVAEMISICVKTMGGLNSLYNDAGIFGDTAPVEDYPLATFEHVWAVNVRGVFVAIQHAVPHLRAAGGGAILNTASTGALVGSAGITAYVASKHAVHGLTRCLALELAPDNISVNVLCPGATDTAMISTDFDGHGRKGTARVSEEIDSITPTGRMARTEELGAVAAWALLEAPVYMTGKPIVVDGAQTTRP